MERVVGRDVEVSGVEVGFFPLSMRIRELVVSDPTGLAPALATVEAVEFRVELIPLLRRQVRISRILVENPEAHLRVSVEGLSNYGDFSSQGPPPPGRDEASGQPLSLELKSVRIAGGSLSLANQEDSLTLDLEGLALEARVQREMDGPWVFSGESTTSLILPPRERVRGAEPLELPLRLAFHLQASQDFNEMEILEGTLGVDPMALSLTGRVSHLRDPVRTVSLDLSGENVPLSTLFEALPDQFRDSLPIRGEGEVTLALKAGGELGPDVTPEVSGEISLARGVLLAPDETRLAQFLDVGLNLQEGGDLQVEAEGEFMNGPFSMGGSIQLMDQRRVDLQLDAYPELSLAQSLLPDPESMELEGRVRADTRITGSLNDPRTLRFNGEASPTELTLRTQAIPVPITVHDGDFTLVGRDAAFRSLSFSLGRDRFSAQGRVGNLPSLLVAEEVLQLRGTVQGPRLDLTTLTEEVPPDSVLNYGKVAFAHLGGRAVAGRSAQEAARELRLVRPDSLPLAGEVTLVLDTLINARGPIEDVRATIGFGPRFIHLSQASIRRYGGTLTSQMNLRLGEATLQPFSFNLSAQGVDAGEFLSATSPLGPVFRGELSLQVEMVGALDSLLLPEPLTLIGSGSFSLREGGMNSTVLSESLATFLGLDELRAPQLQDWASSFVLQNGRVQLAESTLQGAPGQPSFQGGVGLNGSLDLLSAFSLSTERLSAFAQRNLGVVGELAGRTANRPDLVQAIIRIGGSLLSPELEVGPGGGAVPALQEAGAEAQRRIRQQSSTLQNRASSFLRRMIQENVPGTTGPDSLRPDSLRPDSLRPDTTRPDTIRPDTLRPDTLPPDTTRFGRGGG